MKISINALILWSIQTSVGMEKKRIFLALPIEPVDPVVKRMKQLQNQLQNDYRIKWVKSENLHLTLLFFGEVDVKQIPKLIEIIRLSVQSTSPFSFSFLGPGIFKKGKEPRVLWLGIEATNSLIDLKKALDHSMSALDFHSEEKAFLPHLTLGRFLPNQEISPVLDDAVKGIQHSEAIEYKVSKLILFESRLFPEGPIYCPVEVFPFGTSVENFNEPSWQV